MKIRFLTVKSWLIATIGALLGINFTGCVFAVAYGTPEGTFRVVGTVVDQDGQPAVGIGVNRHRDWDNDNPDSYAYSAVTDSRGRFTAQICSFPEDFTWWLKFEDMDGPENGLYADTTWGVEFKASDLHGGEGWNEGTATKAVTFPIRKIDENNGSDAQ